MKKTIAPSRPMYVGQIAKAAHWGFGWDLLKVVADLGGGVFEVVQVDAAGFEVKISPRAAFILANYSLTQTATGWRAEVKGCAWSKHRVIEGADKAAVVGEFRARWGHFNFDDEARAFGQIFGA